MNIKNSKLIHGILALFYCLFGNAAEQDNWYIANEWTVNNPQGIVYYEDNNTGVKQIYVCDGSSTAAKISVYDLNGSLARDITIANTRYYPYDLALDDNGTIYIR